MEFVNGFYFLLIAVWGWAGYQLFLKPKGETVITATAVVPADLALEEE